jgi:hypothetical protein
LKLECHGEDRSLPELDMVFFEGPPSLRGTRFFERGALPLPYLLRPLTLLH